MNSAQEHSVWREIIDADPPSGWLDSSDSLAQLAASGLRLAGAWNAASLLRSATSAQHGNADIRIFAQWLEEFRRRCVTDKLLPAALLEDALAKHVASKTLTIPRELRLVGFGELYASAEDTADSDPDCGNGDRGGRARIVICNWTARRCLFRRTCGGAAICCALAAEDAGDSAGAGTDNQDRGVGAGIGRGSCGSRRSAAEYAGARAAGGGRRHVVYAMGAFCGRSIEFAGHDYRCAGHCAMGTPTTVVDAHHSATAFTLPGKRRQAGRGCAARCVVSQQRKSAATGADVERLCGPTGQARQHARVATKPRHGAGAQRRHNAGPAAMPTGWSWCGCWCSRLAGPTALCAS